MRTASSLLAILFIASRVSAASPHPKSVTIRGTVNVALANSNGMVVLTDSKQTVTDAAGHATASQDGQKLIRLDRYSVCAIAGFGDGTVNEGPKFNADVIAILSDFRDQLAGKKGRLSFYEKLRTLSFLIESYIGAYANMAEVLQPGELRPRDLYFSLILAGYDSDGSPKIGSLQLGAAPNVLPSGKTRWLFHDPDIQIEPVGTFLRWQLGGMTDVGQRIMTSPAKYARSPAVQRILQSAGDNGAGLRVSDLEALAKFIAAATSRAHPDYVGGRNQIAVIRDNKITIEQPSFPIAPKVLPFFLAMDIAFDFEDHVLAPAGTTMIWVRDKIIAKQGLTLDGNFFLDNEIRDSTLWYDGGPTVFESNQVVNSSLRFGPHYVDSRDSVRNLIRPFRWMYCYPFGCSDKQMF